MNLQNENLICQYIQYDTYLKYINEQHEKHKYGDSQKGDMLKLIDILKKISDHPYLLTHNIEEVNVDNLIQTSAKLESTIKILNEVQSKNEKVIIFAEIKNTQKMLKKVIQEKFNLKPSIINGDTPSTQNGEYKEESNNYSRQTAIDKFSEKKWF